MCCVHHTRPPPGRAGDPTPAAGPEPSSISASAAGAHPNTPRRHTLGWPHTRHTPGALVRPEPPPPPTPTPPHTPDSPKRCRCRARSQRRIAAAARPHSMSTELGAASAGVRRPVRMAMLVTTEHTCSSKCPACNRVHPGCNPTHAHAHAHAHVHVHAHVTCACTCGPMWPYVCHDGAHRAALVDAH